jgi:hypothetical protein
MAALVAALVAPAIFAGDLESEFRHPPERK